LAYVTRLLLQGRSTKVLTTERLPEQKSLQLMIERVNRWCWSDTVRQCIPDLSGSNWEDAATSVW